MRRVRLLLLLFLPAAGACGGPATTSAPVPSPAAATTAAITPADLRIRESIFSDDSMLGRRAGTIGNVRGNAYIVAELTRLGLKPAGDAGGFLQRVPVMSYAVDTAKSTLKAGSASLDGVSRVLPVPGFVRCAAAAARRRPGGVHRHRGGLDRDAGARGTQRQSRGIPESSAGHVARRARSRAPRAVSDSSPGIAFTDIDPIIESYSRYLRSPKLVLRDTASVPPGVTQPRLLFVPTASIPPLFGKPLDQLHPGDTAGVIHGDVRYAPTDLAATNVVGIIEGSDPRASGGIRRARRAQ